MQVLIRKENGLSRILTENVTIDGSRIGVQINAEDNRQQGLFMASVSYDVPSEDSETGFIHTVYDIPRAFEIVPLSTEETQGTLFVVSERDVKPQAGGRDGVDGHDGRLRMVNHGTNDTTFALRAGEMHVWGEIYSLNLSLADVDAGYVSEYAFKFSCPRDRGTTLVLPQGVKFADNVVVTPNAGKTYEGSIVEGILVLIAN